ncbi:MAG: NlpC/P60 family protein [Betaproteobacteria bacterium]|nr:MAG: NlpC/P60 family protein [Betaproteobacteria bacterium]
MRHKLLFPIVFFIAVGPAPAVASKAREAGDSPIFHAFLALGARYRIGGSSPETGFDCSGLVRYVFERAWGLLLPRNARAQASVGRPIRHRQDLQPGDLVFYDTRNRPYSHVGIYMGDGRFIHAPRPGKRVREEDMDSPYWRARFNGARRLHPPDAG